MDRHTFNSLKTARRTRLVIYYRVINSLYFNRWLKLYCSAANDMPGTNFIKFWTSHSKLVRLILKNSTPVTFLQGRFVFLSWVSF
jgi:hypothetical protein